MTRAPYLGLSVVVAAGLDIVSLAGMARRLATAAPLVGGDLDAAVRWYAGAIALLPLTAGGLAFFGLALAGTWSLRDGRAALARTVAMLLLPATAVTSWSAGSTAWQGICVATAALCLPVLGYRGRLAVRDPLPAVEQSRPSAPLLTVQR